MADTRSRAVRLLTGLAWAVFAGGALPAVAGAGVPEWAACPTPAPITAGDADTDLRTAGLIQDELRRQGVTVAVVARSGLNLGRIGHRYSHAGFLRPLADGEAGAGVWAVRQLYFACHTRQARVFDEGLAGFLRGVGDHAWPRWSAVWWPDASARILAQAVADDGLALALLSPQYQAQAHAWNLVTQNCNQWLVELLAAAFSGARDRAGAQVWLREQGYLPSAVQLPGVAWLMAAAVLPHMGLAHHPPEGLQALRFEVSLPASIERFVQARWPRAQRLEWCRRGGEVVVRRSWEPLDEACTPGPGDEVKPLEP